MGTMGCPDKPVESIQNDLFNITTYVNGLCSFVRTCDTPMTISIQGDWGSGKTSMMNMMRENLQDAVWSIWFNTWQFSQFDMGNALAFSMMDVLLKGLGCDTNVRTKILKGLIGFGKKAIRVATDTAIGGGAAEVVGDLIDGESNIDYASEIMSLKDKFQAAVNEKLKKENKSRVVIFVDDLDRLQPARAVELLEVLKLFLDCENCVFILAVDYEVVTLGIRQKFGKDVSEEKGRSFFDKIIQLPFKMPVSNYNIRKYVHDMMNNIDMPTDDDSVELFENLIHTSVGFNPRSMKRLFNTYQLLDIVSNATVKGMTAKVRKRILFAIICMQMAYEKLYIYFASSELDSDAVTSFADAGFAAGSIGEIYYDLDNENLQRQVSRITSFMTYFIQALQLDDDAELSEQELETFRIILKSSLVTAISSSDSNESGNQRSWEDRNANKELAKSVAEKLKDIGVFKIWLPRKVREDIKFSDVSGYYCWAAAAGFDLQLEYYITQINNSEIGIHLYVSTQTRNTELPFFETVGENPMNFARKPLKDEWGRYRYLNVLRLNNDDRNAVEQIEKSVRNAYARLKDF